MSRMRWRTWLSAVALGLGAVAALPAHAGPRPGAPDASQKAVEEANRLAEQVAQLEEQGEFAAALPLAERVVALREEAFGPSHAEVGVALSRVALLYKAKGDYARAEPFFQRAQATFERALGPDHPLVAAALSNLAGLYQDRGDYERIEPLYQRALAIMEKAQGPDHIDVSYALNGLAIFYEVKGDYARAEPLYQRALAIIEKAKGPEHPDVAILLNSFGLLYWDKGDYARAEPLYQRALVILEKTLGPEHPDVANALNSLALLYQDKGDYVRAEPLFQRALAIFEKALGAGHPNVAYLLNNLASLHRDRGDGARAEPLFQRALAIREQALGPDHPLVAVTLGNLAGLYQDKGDGARAEAFYRRELIVLERALGPDHPSLATALNNLGTLHRNRGDYGRAEPLFQRALAIFEKAFGVEQADVALALSNLGVLFEDKGDSARAELFYQRALSAFEKALGPEHPHVAAVLSNLSGLFVKQGRTAEAVDALRRAVDLQDRSAAAVLAVGSEEQKRLYMATLSGQTSAALSLHAQGAPADPAAARLALTVLLRRKGRVLDAMTDSLAALRRTLAPGDRALLDQLASVYSELAAHASRAPEKISPEQHRASGAALEQREALEAALGRRSAAFRGQQRLVTLAEVQAALPEGAALVEIARYAPSSFRLHGAGNGALRYVAYVLRRQGEPLSVDLGDAAALEAAVDKLRRALGDHDLSHDPRPAARALDTLLMQPIRELLGDTRWVFLSPDGPLSLLPFSALVDEQGHYLVERTLFSYLTSGRDLLRFGNERVAPREGLLLLADPAFDDASAPGAVAAKEATHRGLRSIEMIRAPLRRLPSTAAEARAIAALFPGARVLLGAQATEGAVKAARGPRLLHLATHGFFLPEQPLPEAQRTGPGDTLSPAARAALAQRENPLLRAGVALAGFNRRQSGNDDGVLTALEASGLDLYGTQLVVLSTCESGLGEAVTGEGVYGLRRALSMAGAETQVMSLWQVDTGRTRELMTAYYQRLSAGEGRSEAIRGVQIAMLGDAETAHPNLWASFVVSGDWRTLEGKARLPEVGRVSPGPRGCACGQAGREGSGDGAWLSLALTAAAASRRRARSTSR